MVGICKDPICQVEPTPTASVQHAKKTTQQACAAFGDTSECLYLAPSKQTQYRVVLLFLSYQGSQSVYFQLLASTAAGLT
jgi:hypothetical protein